MRVFGLIALALLTGGSSMALLAQYPQPSPLIASTPVAQGGQVSWAPATLACPAGPLAFSYPQGGGTGYWAVWTVCSSGGTPACITCSHFSYHCGNPAWSRTGVILVFQCMTAQTGISGAGAFPGFPGEGAWNELWGYNPTTAMFYQLTNQANTNYSVNIGGNISGGTCSPASYTATVTYSGGSPAATGTVVVSGGTLSASAITRTLGGSYPTNAYPTSVTVSGCTGTITYSTVPTMTGSGGVIYKAFSWDNTKFAWGQRLYPGLINHPTLNTGQWELAIGQWSEAGGVPSFTSINYYQPFQAGAGTETYYEPHGWSTDNSTVFFSGQGLSPGTFGVSDYNIFSFNPTTGVLFNLTNTIVNWAEYPTPLPSSYGINGLLYMLYPESSTNASCTADYWFLKFDGTQNYQVTFFNTPGTQYYSLLAPTCMDDMSWNPQNPLQLAAYANDYAESRYMDPMNQGPILILNLINVAGVLQVNSVDSGITFSGTVVQ
jgi:hypothetical protein